MYFSKFNGYDVKDKEAREYIDELRNTKANQTDIERLLQADEQIIAEQERIVGEQEKTNENVSQLSNPNLLINGDFKINQRGQTVYEYGSGTRYTLDRWQTLNSGKLEVIESGIKLTNNSSDGTEFTFRQLLETHLSGNYTLSVKVKSITGSWKSHCNYENGVLDLQVGINSFTFDTLNGDNVDRVQVYSLESNSTIEIEWIKLEQGTIATPFIPRPQQEEYALCQRYYRGFYFFPLIQHSSGSGTYISQTHIDSQMRVRPTLKYANAVYGLSSENTVELTGTPTITGGVIVAYTTSFTTSTSIQLKSLECDSEIY